MKIMPVILASGYGSVRSPEGHACPKVLEFIGGKPMIVRAATALMEAGFASFFVVVNPLFGETIRKILSAWMFGKYAFAYQPMRRGAADAALQAVPLAAAEGATDILVAYADMPLWSPDTIRCLAELHRKETPLLTMITAPLDEYSPKELWRYGRIIRSGDGTILRVVEPAAATEAELAARSVNPSLWLWNLDWIATYAPKAPFVTRQDGFDPEQQLPSLVEFAAREGRVRELVLTNISEALGVNNAAELEVVRKAYSIMRYASIPR